MWWQPVLARTPALSVVVLEHDGVDDRKLRFMGSPAAVELIWRPCFKRTPCLARWEALMATNMSMPVASALRDELMQRGESLQWNMGEVNYAEHVAAHMKVAARCQVGFQSFHQLFADYLRSNNEGNANNNDAVDHHDATQAVAGRLTNLQLACLKGEGSTAMPDAATAASLVHAQLSGCLEQGWHIAVDHVDPCVDPAAIACLTIPAEVNFLSCFITSVSKRCPTLVDANTDALVHTGLCRAHNAILLQCLSMRRPHTLGVTVRNGVGAWKLTTSANDTSTGLQLELFTQAAVSAGPMTTAAMVYEEHLPGELVNLLLHGLSRLESQPSGVTLVAVPLSDAEQHRVDTWVASLQQNRLELLRRMQLLGHLTDRALGAGNRFDMLPDDHRLNVSQRPVDEILNEMCDAGLPEVTMQLLQHMLAEHHHQAQHGTINDSGAGTALAARQTSSDPSDLYCCVCYATSLLEAPVMLQCYHLLCGQCVSRLVAHKLHRCPICNAFTLMAPKVRILLPLPLSPSNDALNASAAAKDEFSNAPTLVAALCHRVLDDLQHHLGIPTASPQQRNNRNWYRNPTDTADRQEDVGVWIVFHSDNALAAAAPFMESLKRKLLACQVGVGLHAGVWRNPFQAQIHAYSRHVPMLGYLVGPQDRSFLALASPAWRQPWCVHKWTWLMFTGTTAATSMQPPLLEDMRRHYGVLLARPEHAPTARQGAEDASTRNNLLRWV